MNAQNRERCHEQTATKTPGIPTRNQSYVKVFCFDAIQAFSICETLTKHAFGFRLLVNLMLDERKSACDEIALVLFSDQLKLFATRELLRQDSPMNQLPDPSRLRPGSCYGCAGDWKLAALSHDDYDPQFSILTDKITYE